MENMDRETIKVEKRKFKRFKIKHLSFALLKYYFYEKLGEIVDISKGGLAFKYLGGKDLIKESDELDIILSGNGFCMKKIPCKTVSDFEITNNLSFTSLKMRRHAVQFGELDNNQMSKLNYFIKHHTIAEAQAS